MKRNSPSSFLPKEQAIYRAMEGASFFWFLPCNFSKSCVTFFKVKEERTWESSCKKIFAFDQFLKNDGDGRSCLLLSESKDRLGSGMFKEEVGRKLTQAFLELLLKRW